MKRRHKLKKLTWMKFFPVFLTLSLRNQEGECSVLVMDNNKTYINECITLERCSRLSKACSKNGNYKK